MKVSEIMTRDVQTAQPDTTVEEIAALMKEEGIGAVPVLDEDGELAGIVTDRDIVVRCVAEGKDASESTVDDIVSEDLSTIEPDADVREAVQLMAGRKIRRLPVVEDGELIGIVSLGDISVKIEDERATGEALQEISQGVKESTNRPARRQASAPSGASRQQAAQGHAESPFARSFEENEAFDLEFSDESEVQSRAAKKTREVPATKSNRGQQSDSTRGAAKEKKAPGRLISIRDHDKSQSRKRGSSHRKTG
jgi:CBS domain-containing protein